MLLISVIKSLPHNSLILYNFYLVFYLKAKDYTNHFTPMLRTLFKRSLKDMQFCVLIFLQRFIILFK